MMQLPRVSDVPLKYPLVPLTVSSRDTRVAPLKRLTAAYILDGGSFR
jgi:hypothetical protein